MGSSTVSPALKELVRRGLDGEYSDAQIYAFLMNPNASARWKPRVTAEHVGTLPRDPDAYRNSQLHMANGVPLYAIPQSHGESRVYWGSRVFHEFAGVSQLMPIGNDACYVTHDVDSDDAIIVHGDVRCAEYSDVRAVQDVGGKPGFWGWRNGKWHVVWNWQEVVSCTTYRHANRQIRMVDGKLLFVAGDEDSCAVHCGDWVSGLHPSISNLMYEDGYPLYTAPISPLREAVFWGGRIVSGEHRGITSLSIALGQPLFEVEEGIRHVIIWGTERFDHFERQQGPRFVNDVLMYTAWNPVGDMEVLIRNERPGPAFAYIHPQSVSSIDGEPVYLARTRSGRWVLVWGSWHSRYRHVPHGDVCIVDGAPLSIAMSPRQRSMVWGAKRFMPFEDIFSVDVTDSHIHYGGRNGRQLYSVSISRLAAQ